jgi:hypothetical protein
MSKVMISSSALCKSDQSSSSSTKFRADNDEVEAAEFGSAFHVLLFLIHGMV